MLLLGGLSFRILEPYAVCDAVISWTIAGDEDGATRAYAAVVAVGRLVLLTTPLLLDSLRTSVGRSASKMKRSLISVSPDGDWCVWECSPLL